MSTTTNPARTLADEIARKLRVYVEGAKRKRDSLIWTDVALLKQAAAELDRLRGALKDLLEMSECDPRDFAGEPPGAYDDCMEDAQRRARAALDGTP